MTMLFRPPATARHVPGVRFPAAYVIETGSAELPEGLAPSEGKDVALVFDDDDSDADPFVVMNLETFKRLIGGRGP